MDFELFPQLVIRVFLSLFLFDRQFSFDLISFLGWMIFRPKAFHERGQPSAVDLLNKKVWIGSFIALSIFGMVTRARFMFVCLLCSLRQCRLHCYCLLDWNAHAHQHLMRKGGRAIWTFGSITDCTVIFFLPFVAPFLSVPHNTPPFFFLSLHYTCSSRRLFGPFRLADVIPFLLYYLLWLDLRGSRNVWGFFFFFACRKK
jgi:hypothetical protein